jgi:predicted Rossmann fold nucleotide-binding protein DprA/Smf involved in DNA uptake
MTKRKGKAVSFDAMVKFFMHNYNIPTKRDIDRLNERLDRLEKLIRASPPRVRRQAVKNDGASPASATDTVLNLIKNSQNGIGIAEIREETGYDDKKLRNIIYRLNQMGKISRVNRGHYKTKE